MELKNVAVVIPTLNAGNHLAALIPALQAQGLDPSRFFIVDSSSDDGTAEAFRAFGARVHTIKRSEFNHGGTRRLAAQYNADAEVLIYLTQDAVPADGNAIRNILTAFEDPSVAIAYGRQLPRKQAKAIERHARLINYPDRSEVRTRADRERLGIKTIFCSNSFAAYRCGPLEEVGNFPNESFFGEDQIVSARLILAGYKIAYCADAKVYHSHGYSIKDDFQRYFDIGVFHGRNKWMLESFGKAEGQGVAFLVSEFRYLAMNEPASIPSAVIRTGCKYVAYKLGNSERSLSSSWKRRLSAQPFYWKDDALVR